MTKRFFFGCFGLDLLGAPEGADFLEGGHFTILFAVVAGVPVPGSFLVGKAEASGFDGFAVGVGVACEPYPGADDFNFDAHQMNDLVDDLHDLLGYLRFVGFAGFGEGGLIVDEFF